MRAPASIRATSSARSCDRARLSIAPVAPIGTRARARSSIHVNRLEAGRYALAVRAGDYAESRDALAISVSPQHVRTHVIGLEVDGSGAIRAAAAPASAAFDARRQADGS